MSMLHYLHWLMGTLTQVDRISMSPNARCLYTKARISSFGLLITPNIKCMDHEIRASIINEIETWETKQNLSILFWYSRSSGRGFSHIKWLHQKQFPCVHKEISMCRANLDIKQMFYSSVCHKIIKLLHNQKLNSN